MTTTVNLEVSGGGSVGGGSTYLGPMTWAELQASAYADGSVGLAALEADASVFVTDRDVAYIPNDAKTAWTAGKTGELIDVATLAARQVAGTPVPVGTPVIDPATGLIYGQSDGAGGYSTIGGGGMRVDSTSGYLVDDLGGVFAVIEQTPILTTLTASGVGKNAPTEFSGLDVTAINGQTTATIYDNASAASGNILAVFVLSTVGHYPVDSAWTRPVGGKGVVSAVNGVYVSFSGGTSRTVNVLG